MIIYEHFGVLKSRNMCILPIKNQIDYGKIVGLGLKIIHIHWASAMGAIAFQ